MFDFFLIKKVYYYNESIEILTERLNCILNEKESVQIGNDIQIFSIAKNSFTINLISNFSRNFFYQSTLKAEVIGVINTLEIRTKIKPALILFVLFFFSLFFGVAYFYNFILSTKIEFLIWSLILIIGGPAISILVANISSTALYNKFDNYIDKRLRNNR